MEKIWLEIINNGIRADTSPEEYRKIRLLNAIAFTGLCSMLGYSLLFIGFQLFFALIVDLIGVVVFSVPLYLQSNFKYNWARIILLIGMYIFFLSLCVMYGEQAGLEYSFIIGSIVPILFFEQKKYYVPLFLLGVACFYFCRYYYDHYIPWYPSTYWAYMYNTNMLVVFLITFFILLQFKGEYESYQGRIIEQNQALVQQKEEIEAQRDLIEVERNKSDQLLLNILPEETAAELKETGQATPREYPMATVLFTDFKGFTQISELLSPQQIIEELNVCFLAFDEICEKHQLEKIKTIGDAYMAVGGVPVPNTTNPIDAVMAGLEIQAWMEEWKKQKKQRGEPTWEVRIGIHTGEVVAGVVGKNKFAYDVWGDTVNLASRMESSGEVGKVNISEETYQHIKGKFDCAHRGKIEAKNKGEVDMYFVEMYGAI
jgi:class 3 adenylate cyclase